MIKPAAWISPNVYPFRKGKDNHLCILTPFRCASNTTPLYADTEVQELYSLLEEATSYLHNQYDGVKGMESLLARFDSALAKKEPV